MCLSHEREKNSFGNLQASYGHNCTSTDKVNMEKKATQNIGIENEENQYN